MGCIKFIMFGFNVVFWLAGAAMLGVGIWLAVDPYAFDALGAAESAGMDNEMWAIAVYTFIGIGALVFLIGFLGCWGACISESSSVPLYIYSVLVGICVLAEIVIVILVAIYWGSADEDVANSMYNDCHNKYVGEQATDALSSSWNTMQQEWECCGSRGPDDYLNSAYDNLTTTPSGKYIPATCCDNLDDDDDDDEENDACQRGVGENLYTKGCYYALNEFLDQNAPLIIGLTCAFAALQIIGLIFACCLIHDKSDGGKYV